MRNENALSCRRAIEELWAYIDGELPRDEVDRVHAHLEACRACYPNYDFQKAFREFLGRQASQPAPVSLRKRVFLRLLAEEKKAEDA
jgi:anti-sigma factor (TIGR02949 family)